MLSHINLRNTARVRIFRDRMVQFVNNEIELLERRKPKKKGMTLPNC
jgi:hypothetical protein